MGRHIGANAAASAYSAATVSPNDSVEIPVTRGLYIGVTGDLRVQMAGDDTDVTFLNIPVGFAPLQVNKVFASSTTASGIIALR